MHKLLNSEDWDMNTSASSPDFSYETLPSYDFTDTRCTPIIDTTVRKHSKKLTQAKKYSLQSLKRNIQLIEIQNAKLRSENTQLKDEITFCRQAVLRNRTLKSSGGINSKSALYSIALAMILAVSVNIDLSSTEESGTGSRKMLMNIDNSVSVLKYVMTMIFGCVGIWLICKKKKTVDNKGMALC